MEKPLEALPVSRGFLVCCRVCDFLLNRLLSSSFLSYYTKHDSVPWRLACCVMQVRSSQHRLDRQERLKRRSAMAKGLDPDRSDIRAADGRDLFGCL